MAGRDQNNQSWELTVLTTIIRRQRLNCSVIKWTLLHYRVEQ